MSVHPARHSDVVLHDPSSFGNQPDIGGLQRRRRGPRIHGDHREQDLDGVLQTTFLGSGSTAAGPIAGSALPQFAFLTFLGLPDFGGEASTGGARSDGALFAFPLTLSLPDFATSNHGSGPDLDPIEWAESLVHGGSGATAVLVPVGGAILLFLATYMVSTWTQDRRRARRVVPALARGRASADSVTGPSKPEEPVHQP